MLSPKERLLRAGKKQPVDRPPCICPGGMMNMVFKEIMDMSGHSWPEAHSDADKMASLTAAVYESGGFENFGVPFCLTVEAEGMGAEVEMGNKIVEPHINKTLLQEVTEWRKLKPLDLSQGRIKVVLDAISILKSKGREVPVIGNLSGPITVAGSLMDFTDFLKEIRRNPTEVHEVLDFIVKNTIRFGRAQLEAGADVICISEPSGTGEILGKKWFSQYTVGYINRLVTALDAPLTIVHICGDLSGVYELLPRLACDIFSFDAITPMAAIRGILPHKAVMGNLNTHALLTQEEDNIRRLVENCYVNGADIIAPACGLSTITPLRNIKTVVKAAKDHIY